ncbi:hypothetical protein [Clostridium sp. YIM B02500]|nr:hypothetical protein [Clostridium sp. YIM B02500]
MINVEKKTVELWELHGLAPAAKSSLLTFVRGDYGLSYDMYFKMKKVGVF